MRLKDVCTIQMGYTPRHRLGAVDTGGVPAIQLRDLSANGYLDPAKLSRYNLAGATGRYLVRPGDVLFRSRGERNTATTADERLVEPAVAVSPLIVLRPRREVIEPRFLEWAINQRPAQRYFDSRARGTSLRMVPKSSLDDLEIDVPDLATQRALIRVDDLAAREQELSFLAAEKRRQLMSVILVERAKKLCPPRGQERTRK